ncbi:mitochondrial import inner membrane translocase subunit TIM50-C-like [Diorhabda sublineata]|uniref:mitochondrial import inner membrane translocase subunit TIM50-C-like n=1 Tax=Diorhabda sublineata TaxID=1163346 RepID=UPI0024E064A6|nr:mitochondrial import inner membrane translocase subunit TIM50-C-like [Diorhabda sublineata]
MRVVHPKLRIHVISIVFSISLTCICTYVIYTFGKPEEDTDGNLIKDGLEKDPIILQYLLRTYREILYMKKLVQQPLRDKLLPDPLGPPYSQPKYTLVLELTDVLVHPEWTYHTGLRFKKRPFLAYFLETMKESYEIVIYTAEQGVTVFPLIEAIDPENIIAYKLVRDATKFVGGYYIKRLENINRDLRKVICIDWNLNCVRLNCANLLKVKRWNGNDDDTALVDLASLLKAIADNGIEDVREVLIYYSKYDDPVGAFREKEKRLIEELEAHAAANRNRRRVPRFWIARLFSKRPVQS